MKTALVTGTSRGIGRAIAEKLLAQGYRVCGVSRTAVCELGTNYRHFACDLSKPSELGKLVEDLESEEFDVLIFNAGMGEFHQVGQFSESQIRTLIELNLTAPLLLSNALISKLRTRVCASAIFIGSSSGYAPARFGSIYGATKAALRHFALSLFEEVRKSGVRVAYLAPDLVRTGFYQGQMFSPGDGDGEALEIGDVVGAVTTLLELREGLVMPELILKPQRIGVKKG